MEYSVKPLGDFAESEIKSIIFFVKNDNASWRADDYFSIPEKNKEYGFDICPYIYPHYYTGNCKVGDINGDNSISATDAAKSLQLYSVSQSQAGFELHEKQIEYADMNGDGIVSASDSALILAEYAQSQIK